MSPGECLEESIRKPSGGSTRRSASFGVSLVDCSAKECVAAIVSLRYGGAGIVGVGVGVDVGVGVGVGVVGVTRLTFSV